MGTLCKTDAREHNLFPTLGLSPVVGLVSYHVLSHLIL